MAKLLYVDDEGLQRVAELGPGASETFTHPVLWDERKDGPLVFDPARVGGYERVGSSLLFAGAKKEEQDADVEAKALEAAAIAEKEQATRAQLLDVDKVSTVEELRAVVKALIEKLGYL